MRFASVLDSFVRLTNALIISGPMFVQEFQISGLTSTLSISDDVAQQIGNRMPADAVRIDNVESVEGPRISPNFFEAGDHRVIVFFAKRKAKARSVWTVQRHAAESL